jgi:hypothetical protein
MSHCKHSSLQPVEDGSAEDRSATVEDSPNECKGTRMWHVRISASIRRLRLGLLRRRSWGFRRVWTGSSSCSRGWVKGFKAAERAKKVVQELEV